MHVAMHVPSKLMYSHAIFYVTVLLCFYTACSGTVSSAADTAVIVVTPIHLLCRASPGDKQIPDKTGIALSLATLPHLRITSVSRVTRGTHGQIQESVWCWRFFVGPP